MDALPRRSKYRPEKGGVENQPIVMVLQENHFVEQDRQKRSFICSLARLASLPEQRLAKEFVEEIRRKAKEDADYQQGWMQAKKKAELGDLEGRKAKEGTLAIQDGLLYRKGKLWPPKEVVQEIQESEHDTKIARHMGQDKTIELI